MNPKLLRSKYKIRRSKRLKRRPRRREQVGEKERS
jgi:hypothetical protein